MTLLLVRWPRSYSLLVSSFCNIAEPEESEEVCVSFSEPLRAAGLLLNNPHGPGPEDQERRRGLKGVGTNHVQFSAEFSGGGRKGLDLGLQDPEYLRPPLGGLG